MLKTIKYTIPKWFLCSFLLYGLNSVCWANADVQSLQIAQKTIQVEIADTESTRRLGLMHRTSLAKDHGMLFIFNDSNWHCFWMKNTLMPLSIAFIDEKNTIIDIQDMQARSLESICPPQKVNQALEMELGWFESNNINIGEKIEFN